MSEKKFRAWDKRNKQMIYDGDVWSPFSISLDKQLPPQKVSVFNRVVVYSYSPISSSYVKVVRVNDSTQTYYKDWDYDMFFSVDLEFMQSTGLKDKNGKDLDWWEGDLLRKGSDHPNAPIGKIMYDEWAAKWSIVSKGYERGKSTEFCGLVQAYMNGWKKIGTIHNLLKEGPK